LLRASLFSQPRPGEPGPLGNSQITLSGVPPMRGAGNNEPVSTAMATSFLNGGPLRIVLITTVRVLTLAGSARGTVGHAAGTVQGL
jgi:hypothetical protein